ncbi:hypothetical protein GRAN_3588 [Granulicella sibirica]|uniref:Uncharacterized protein n=1 Tax=Granulicella sibirica TaxID=2479048 RepID=A0A4Q0STY9_9BACT|nr:hypothetical protein GRAN_3588 [Granulicella sibirica]
MGSSRETLGLVRCLRNCIKHVLMTIRVSQVETADRPLKVSMRR